LYWLSHDSLEQKLRLQISQHLENALSPTLFSNDNGRINDLIALQQIGTQINLGLENLLNNRWFSALHHCQVQLQSIDDIDIEPANTRFNNIHFNLQYNKITRNILLNYQCQTNFPIYLLLLLIVTLLLTSLRKLKPETLSKEAKLWLKYLGNRGYQYKQAQAALHNYNNEQLSFNAEQWTEFKQFHQPELKNATDIIQLLNSDRYTQLSSLNKQWFTYGYIAQGIDQAWELADANDEVMVDLASTKLTIRGIAIAIRKTPLFYYAWYLQQRKLNEGWILNPRSDKPDIEQGKIIVELMSKFNGNEKAIRDLEDNGLKAKTLNQNRSKIKMAFINCLGENLAQAYLFESKKDSKSDRVYYRVSIKPENISLNIKA
jgi:hypothetical protein